ncbi:MAG TPA: hypothetical protein VHA30_04145 [Patescibacteria group bacterium]|nr:hypothetical protein [Patescibacteria group bacterium]
MTSPINNFQRRAAGPDQAGVTLLLAILILSSILAISFSLATVMFIEIRASGDLLRTEPALYAANGIGEEAIFNVKRQTCTAQQDNCVYTTQNFTNNVKFPAAPVASSTTTPVFEDKVAPATSFSSGNNYSFYNPGQGSSASGSGYGQISLTYLNTGNQDTLYVYLCEFDPNAPVDPTGQTPNSYNSTACTDPTDTLVGNNVSYWKVKSYAMKVSINPTATWTLDPSKQQELFLYNPSAAGNNIYVQLETFGPQTPPGSGYYPPQGLPYSGETSVEVNSVNGPVGRKIKVTVPY